MLASSSGSSKARLAATLVALGCAFAASAQDWYVSDASGIALRRTTGGRARELEYGLSVETFAPSDRGDAASAVPETVRSAVPSGGKVELRTLYEKGAVLRRRYAALDPWNAERLIETHEKDGSFARERYDPHSAFVEEARFGADGSGTIIRYTYASSRLIRAEAFSVAVGAEPASREEREKALWIETYYYTRSGALRSVERRTPEGEDAGTAATEGARFDTLRGVPRLLETRSADGSTSRTKYDSLGRLTERAAFDPEGRSLGVEEITAREDSKERVSTTQEEDGTRVVTTLDERGRVVSERRTSPDGVLISESRNVWSGNRIASVETVSPTETRRTEYEYDASENRRMERNYRNGVLERTVRSEDGKDTEELYSDGIPVLRAVWMGGRKVSEERLRKGEEAGR